MTDLNGLIMNNKKEVAQMVNEYILVHYYRCILCKKMFEFRDDVIEHTKKCEKVATNGK